MLEKSKQLVEANKEREEMRVKQEFDHHMIEEKDSELDKLRDEKKALKQLLES